MKKEVHGINASIHGWINNYISERPLVTTTTKDIYLSDHTKDEIGRMFFDCISFEVIGDGYIEFTINRTQEELEEQKEDHKQYKKSILNSLVISYYMSDEYKKQIESYLKRNNLDYVLEDIKQ